MKEDSRVAIISDLHLGVHMNSPTWHEISIEWAKWLVNELAEKDITKIIFCGDFFHNRSEITVNTLHAASDLLEYFKDFELYMITGNHDSFYKNDSRVNSISILNGRRNITVIDKPTTMQLYGKELFFAPWGVDLNDIPESDIMFGHFEIESFKMNSFKTCDHGFKTKDLLKLAPLVISGHFHLREERKYENGNILYVGCPFELDFGDAGSQKGYYILDIKTSQYVFYPNNISPKHYKIPLSELIKIQDFNTEGKKLFNKNIVKLTIDKIIDNADLEKLSVKINSHEPINLLIDHLSNFDRFGAGDQNEIDLSGIDISRAITEFVDMLDIQNKKEVTEYTVSLYNSCK